MIAKSGGSDIKNASRLTTQNLDGRDWIANYSSSNNL